MTVYTYKARDDHGNLVTGAMDADSDERVLQQIRQKQLTPIKITQGGTLNSATSALGSKGPMSSFFKTASSKKARPQSIKISDLLVFCLNLSSMVNAGIPLLGALKAISGQLTNPYLGYVVGEVAERVSEGQSLADSLAKHPKVFSKYFISMIRVGEASGTMDSVLKSLAIYMEDQENIRQKIVGAVTYPTVLVVAGMGVILVILTFVMPKFVEIFQKSNVPLPLPTMVLYNIGNWLKQYWLFFLVGAFAAAAGLKAFAMTRPGRIIFDTILLKTPVIGPLIGNILVARFSRTLATLLNAGVALLQSLEILAGVIDNYVYEKIVNEVYLNAEKGEGIHQALDKRKEFPKDVVYMISVGEQSGKMGEMLNKIADFYESKVDFALKGLLVFIEPVLISFMGACAGGMLASVILPMFDLVKTIQQ